MPLVAVTAPSAQARVARAAAWLRERAPAEEILILAGTSDAANELVRKTAAERGAAFGWQGHHWCNYHVRYCTAWWYDFYNWRFYNWRCFY